jgi:hypothetical protein
MEPTWRCRFISYVQLFCATFGPVTMADATYEVIRYGGGWGVNHHGNVAGPFASKEAALEAALGPAMNAIKQGQGVRLIIPGSGGTEATLGTREQ